MSYRSSVKCQKKYSQELSKSLHTLMRSNKLNNSHFVEAAQTNRSLYLYMQRPWMKWKHDMSQSTTMSNTKCFRFECCAEYFVTWPGSTHHIRDVQDLPGHGIFVMTRRGSEPDFLERLIHQFLKAKVRERLFIKTASQLEQHTDRSTHKPWSPLRRWPSGSSWHTSRWSYGSPAAQGKYPSRS